MMRKFKIFASKFHICEHMGYDKEWLTEKALLKGLTMVMGLKCLIVRQKEMADLIQVGHFFLCIFQLSLFVCDFNCLYVSW